MTKIFVTSTGTETGKTLITCALLKHYRNLGKNVIPLKPIISGFNFAETPNDISLICQSADMQYQSEIIAEISKYIYSLPLSPDMAAQKEGKSYPQIEEIEDFINSKNNYDIKIIEGAGGLMVPFNKTEKTIDLIEETADEVILVAGSYLGSLSHTLSAYEVLKDRKVKVKAIFVSQKLQNNDELYIDLEDTAKSLENFISEPIIKIPYMDSNFDNKTNKLKEIISNVGIF